MEMRMLWSWTAQIVETQYMLNSSASASMQQVQQEHVSHESHPLNAIQDASLRNQCAKVVAPSGGQGSAITPFRAGQ